MAGDTLICDIEIYKNYFLVGLKRVSDGKLLFLEESYLPGEDTPRVTIDRERLRKILLGNRIVTFNGNGFDGPLLWYFIDGASVAAVKRAANQIIEGNVRPWDVENLLGIRIPRQFNHIDLIEVQPNAFASLKTLNGRLHGKKMQDLPYEPNAVLTAEEMDLTTEYCGNDLDATHLLLDALEEPLKLREALGEKFGMDLRSKSDAQMGETIIKRRVEELTGRKIVRVETPPGTTFRYNVPPYLRFERPELQAILERLRTTDFVVKPDGKVDMPKWLSEQDVTIGSTTYAMGIGGLHSTEKNRSVHSDFDHEMIDFDVASYYPAIILGSGLYPKALGPEFLRVYGDIRRDRVAAKRRAQEIGREIDALKALLAEAEHADG